MKEDKLAVIVKDSGLETTKAKEVLEQFGDYFKIADEWEKKAKMIVVNDVSQKADMQMARVGRLFLRDKINDVEKFRKQLKDQYVRGGRAVDTVAHFLKDLMIPTRDYLHEQENFIKIKQAEETERKRLEVEQEAEQKRIAAEKAESERIEKERLDNIRLRKEADAKEKEMEAEREAAEKKQREIKEAAEKKFEAERQRNATKLRKEQEKSEAERKERERIQAELDALIECPFCHKKFKLEEQCQTN